MQSSPPINVLMAKASLVTPVLMPYTGQLLVLLTLRHNAVSSWSTEEHVAWPLLGETACDAAIMEETQTTLRSPVETTEGRAWLHLQFKKESLAAYISLRLQNIQKGAGG